MCDIKNVWPQANNHQKAPPQDPWEELEPHLPSRNQLTVTEAIELWAQIGQTDSAQARKQALAQIRGEYGEDYLSFELRGPTQIAQGETPIIVVSFRQSVAFNFLFDTTSTSLQKYPYYAEIQNPETKDSIRARIKYASQLKGHTPDHLIVSRNVAQALGIQERQQVVIPSIYINPEDVNLDEL